MPDRTYTRDWDEREAIAGALLVLAAAAALVLLALLVAAVLAS